LDRYLVQHIEGFTGPIRIERRGNRLRPRYVLHTPDKIYLMRTRPGPQTPSKASTLDPFEREFRLHWALSGSPLPLAKMLCLCMDESVIGRAFYVVVSDCRILDLEHESNHKTPTSA
jgi:aminoglycoside phosphotransferase (APT) family kinase protein